MPRLQRGFTLIELLVVVVIIGILAAIAVPKFGHAREKAKRAVLVSDLRNLATAEEGYFYERRVYSPDIDSLRFSASNGTVVTIGEASNTGWSALASQPNLSSVQCAVFFGSAAVLAPATIEGVVGCQ